MYGLAVMLCISRLTTSKNIDEIKIRQENQDKNFHSLSLLTMDWLKKFA